MTKTKAIIIGGGFTGLAAAYDLVKAGLEVTVIERDLELGGLAGTFEVSPGHRLERFYHHWFSSDLDIIDLLVELGFESKLRYIEPNTGLYFANSIFRLASPLDLLRFTPLPLLDRIRTGLMALRVRRVENWPALESLSAEEWLRKMAGKKSFEVIWQPLLHGKFGVEAANVSAVWIWNKLKLRGSSRNKTGAEQLVYFDGGFNGVLVALKSALEGLGVKILLEHDAKEILREENSVRGVRTNSGELKADLVLATIPLPSFLKLASFLPAFYREPPSKIRFLGNVCLVLRLKRSLSSTYWLNVADPTFPFVGVIEHTNFDSKDNYGGEHIAYVSKYLPTSDPLFALNDQEYFDYCLPYLQKIFPEFSAGWLIGHKTWRAEYSQPVITKHYSKLIPASKTPVKGLWLSTMAQVYPEDRGTNYAVRYGRKVAKEILGDLAATPSAR